MKMDKSHWFFCGYLAASVVSLLYGEIFLLPDVREKVAEETEQRVMVEAKKETCATEIADLRKCHDEYWDEIERYAELSVETICFDEMEGLKNLIEAREYALTLCNVYYRTDWMETYWCKENCKIPDEKELERWAESKRSNYGGRN